MPSTLTALFATAIHEARVAEADPSGLNRAASLLVTAAGARRVEWRLASGRLEVNGTPVTDDSPGASLICEAFATHHAAALSLPPALNLNQWSEVAAILAAARGLYPSPEHIRVALAGAVPGIGFVATQPIEPDDPELAAALREIPDMSAFADAVSPDDAVVVQRDTERSEFSGVLDPLLEEGRDAVAAFDWGRTAEVLLGLAELAARSDDGGRAMVVRERRRTVPESALQRLVREYPAAGPGSLIGRALMTLGNDGAEAVLEVLAARPAKAQHRHYLELLTNLPGAEQALIRAVGSSRDHLVRDAAEVLGRRRLEGAVPILGTLLRHGNAEVRTAAWRALEEIGTEDAVRMIR